MGSVPPRLKNIGWELLGVGERTRFWLLVEEVGAAVD